MYRSTPPLVSSPWPKERVSEKWERTAPKKVGGKGWIYSRKKQGQKHVLMIRGGVSVGQSLLIMQVFCCKVIIMCFCACVVFRQERKEGERHGTLGEKLHTKKWPADTCPLCHRHLPLLSARRSPVKDERNEDDGDEKSSPPTFPFFRAFVVANGPAFSRPGLLLSTVAQTSVSFVASFFHKSKRGCPHTSYVSPAFEAAPRLACGREV